MDNCSMNISIDEVKQLKLKLEDDLRDLLDKFQKTTGVFPGKINLETVNVRMIEGENLKRIIRCHVVCELD